MSKAYRKRKRLRRLVKRMDKAFLEPTPEWPNFIVRTIGVDGATYVSSNGVWIRECAGISYVADVDLDDADTGVP